MNKKSVITLSTIHVILVVLFVLIFDYQQNTDSPRYIGIANEFTSLKFDFSPKLNCFTAPGYPLFLALVKFITWHNKYLIAIVQAILFTLALFYFIETIQKKHTISKRYSILLFALILICPDIIHLNGTTLTESLCATLLLLICGSAIASFENTRNKLLMTISFTFLVLTKMEYIVLLALIIPYLYYIKKYKLLLTNLLVLSVALILNGIKNKEIYGVFNPTSFGSGSVIYGGNNLTLSGSWHLYGTTKGYIQKEYEIKFDSINKLSPQCSCIKRDSLYKKMALAAWKANSFNQLKVIPLKAAKLWLLPGNFDFYTGQSEIFQGLQLNKLFNDEHWPWYAKYKHGIYLLVYWSYLLISLIGLYIKLKTKGFDKIDFFLLSVLLLNTAIYSIPFYGLGRFHLPVISILFYYSVYFIQGVLNKVNAKYYLHTDEE